MSNARLRRHNSSLPRDINLFSSRKKKPTVVLPFGQAADSMFKLKRIMNDPEKQRGCLVLLFT